jgi:hypothetical protein
MLGFHSRYNLDCDILVVCHGCPVGRQIIQDISMQGWVNENPEFSSSDEFRYSDCIESIYYEVFASVL